LPPAVAQFNWFIHCSVCLEVIVPLQPVTIASTTMSPATLVTGCDPQVSPVDDVRQPPHPVVGQDVLDHAARVDLGLLVERACRVEVTERDPGLCALSGVISSLVAARDPFQRVAIPTRQSRVVHLRVPVRDLAYWDEARHRFVVEPDTLRLLVGSSSADIKVTGTARVLNQ